MAYDPNATYIFTNGETGETFTLDGTDPLAKEAMMNGLPISVTENGERFIYPFVTQEGNSVVVHLPNWFKESDEYLEWEYMWAPTIPNTEINPYTVSIMNKTLDRLGREAAAKRTSNETNLTVAPEKTTTTTQETQQSQQDFWSQNVFQNYNVTVVAIGIAIIIANRTAIEVKRDEPGWTENSHKNPEGNCCFKTVPQQQTYAYNRQGAEYQLVSAFTMYSNFFEFLDSFSH